MKRCVNIDWLEVYCLEPSPYAHLDADYFSEHGYIVRARDYGTRVYQEMFTLVDPVTTEPIIEIRRNPCGNQNPLKTQVLDPLSCHVRLTNRTCYYNNAAKFLDDFLRQHGYIVSRISRLDIALDFERFDTGDDPKKFLLRYLAGRYSKVNQATIHAHGQDLWDGRDWNSVSWGAPKSMIGTKLYCKTLELAQVKDKPYIRQAWAAAGLVDDFITLTRRKVDGTIYKPAIWRLEFSIRSSVRRWYVIEERTTPKQPLRSIHHTLDQYYTRQQLLDHFAALIPNYFHFKVYERDRRKDRCPDKTLFRFERDVDVHYQLEHVATATPADGTLLSLLNRLEAFRASHYFLKDLRNACDILIHYLEDNRLRLSASMPWNADEVALLRLLVQRNTQATHQGQPTIDLPTYRSMVSLLVDEHAFFSGDKDHTDNI